MNHLAPEVRTTLIAVFATLALSNIGLFFKMRIWTGRDDVEIRDRIRTWWAIAGLLSLALFVSPSAGVAFFGFVSFLALKEFLSMTPTRRADRRVLFYAYLAVPIQYYFAGSNWYVMFVTFIPVFMFAWLPTRMWMIGQTEGFLRAAGTLHWALMVTVFSLSHAAYLLAFEPATNSRIGPQFPSLIAAKFPGPGLLLFLIMMTEMNDIFQFCWGKAFGKRKVAPTVSPGKTYAGLIGGVASTIALSWLIGPILTPMDVPRSLFAGVIIALAGFAGDLCVSALKRDLKIKDFGATLPGHGGVLDRVDSLVLSAPLFFQYIYYCYGS